LSTRKLRWRKGALSKPQFPRYHQDMSARYREHAAPERLRPFVECFWSMGPGEALPEYPVLPDGCVDIVYSPSTGPQIVGTMTRVQRFTIAAGQLQIGVRFRPGTALGFVRVPGCQTTDRLLPLDDAWGAEGRQLSARIGEAKTAEQCIALLEAELVSTSESDVVRKMSAYIVQRGGQVRVDDLAFDAAMSARQLRRVFLEQMGLTPKHFCRVIRFRHSLPRLRGTPRGDWTQVALDCGYYDQAHFINEFREFSGYTPGEFAALPR
jgi:AraC-like DNA-binding protein